MNESKTPVKQPPSLGGATLLPPPPPLRTWTMGGANCKSLVVLVNRNDVRNKGNARESKNVLSTIPFEDHTISNTMT